MLAEVCTTWFRSAGGVASSVVGHARMAPGAPRGRPGEPAVARRRKFRCRRNSVRAISSPAWTTVAVGRLAAYGFCRLAFKGDARGTCTCSWACEWRQRTVHLESTQDSTRCRVRRVGWVLSRTEHSLQHLYPDGVEPFFVVIGRSGATGEVQNVRRDCDRRARGSGRLPASGMPWPAVACGCFPWYGPWWRPGHSRCFALRRIPWGQRDR